MGVKRRAVVVDAPFAPYDQIEVNSYFFKTLKSVNRRLQWHGKRMSFYSFATLSVMCRQI